MGGCEPMFYFILFFAIFCREKKEKKKVFTRLKPWICVVCLNLGRIQKKLWCPPRIVAI
jgi:hypothetical protein